MKKTLLAALASVLLATGAGPVAAQLPAQKPTVFSVPLSNRVIEGEVAFADGRIVKFGVLEGGLLSLESAEGRALAISGEILDEERREVRFAAFEIQQFGPGLQGLNRIGELDVRDGKPDASSTLKLPQVLVSAIRTSEEFNADEFQALRQAAMEALPGELIGNPILGTCCVACGNTRTCGCSVTDSCGSCCSDPCCGGGGSPQPQTRD